MGMRRTSKPTGSKNTVDSRKSSNGKARSQFALPERHMFPLNTPGRVAAAPGDAARAYKAGTISKSEERTVQRKAAAKRKSK